MNLLMYDEGEYVWREDVHETCVLLCACFAFVFMSFNCSLFPVQWIYKAHTHIHNE